MLSGMFASNILPALTAQTGPQDATFGKITCSGLDVVNDKERVAFSIKTWTDVITDHVVLNMVKNSENGNSLFWLCYRSDGDNSEAII